MTGDTPDARPVDGLQDQLDRIETTAAAAARDAAAARTESEATNGRLRQVEEDLYGPTEERRRAAEPGLMARFAETRALAFDLRTARDESQAVKDVKKWMVGIGLSTLGVLAALLTLMVQIARAL